MDFVMVDVTLRPVRPTDLELLLAWRSDPRIYEHFKEQSEPLSWQDHLEWFANRPPKRQDLLIEYHGRRVGSVAIAADGEVSVYVGEVTLWGAGVAKAALEEACSWSGRDDLYAQIHEDNDRSLALFEGCGFVRDGISDGWTTYRYPADDGAD